jgi:hypothetical protein
MLFKYYHKPYQVLFKNTKPGAVMRLHVCGVHAVIGVEDREREHVHNAQVAGSQKVRHRGRCSDLWLCGRVLNMHGASRLRKSTRSSESTVWSAMW